MTEEDKGQKRCIECNSTGGNWRMLSNGLCKRCDKIKYGDI